MTTTIITHDRTVHADDVFAAAILRICFGPLKVIRTRDPAILQELRGRDDTFLLDVGGKYDPDLRLFDHHQPDGAGFRDVQRNEWPYATAGLIWKHFGQQAVRMLHPKLDEESVREIAKFIDDTVLKYIDAVDCGVRLKSSGPSLSAVIASFNNAWYEPEEENFPLVLDLAHVLMMNFVKRIAGKVMARDRVRLASTLVDGSVLVLEGCHPWSSVVAEEMPSVLLVVYPVDSGKQWQIRCANNVDTRPRMYMPASWGGRERDEFAGITGEPQATFCHRSRHLAGAFSKQAALNLAQLAISQHLLTNEVKAA
jgi:uncharacterized UPF0160 family protein